MLTFPLTLNVKPVNLSDEQFYQLCLANPDIPMERSRNGELIVMSPVNSLKSTLEN